jgi:type I restriction enzyme S subunit
VLPDIDIMNAFTHNVRPIFDTIHNGQNKKLSELRDTLLPKLLSGEIDLTSEVVE